MPKYRRGDGSVMQRGRKWWLSYYVDGKRVREATDATTAKQARTLLQKKIGERAAGTLVVGADKVTYDELSADFLADYRANGRRSLRNAEMRLRLHLTPFFGGKRAHMIAPADVTAYVAYRQGEGAPNGTINRELACLKRMFTLGIDGGKIIRRPKVRMLEENNVRQGFFEQHELEALVPHLPEWLRPPVSFAYLTGWRLPSEILPLAWSNVDLDAGTVRLDPGTTKSKEGRVIYLTEEMAGLLQRQWETRPDGCSLVFHRSGRKILYPWAAWRRACAAAKLHGRLIHDCRRTAIRNMVRAGIPDAVAMKLSGHKTRAVFDRYAIVSDRDLQDAAARLNLAFRPRTDTELDTTRGSATEARPVSH